MTDGGARRTVKEALKVDDDYGYMSMEVVLVKAGYRAGLEEAWSAFVEIRRKQSAVDACEEFGRWLDDKLKEQP